MQARLSLKSWFGYLTSSLSEKSLSENYGSTYLAVSVERLEYPEEKPLPIDLGYLAYAYHAAMVQCDGFEGIIVASFGIYIPVYAFY